MSFIETESVEMFTISMMSTLHMFIQLTLGYACHTWPRNRELLVYLCLWHDWYFRYPRVYFSFFSFFFFKLYRFLDHWNCTSQRPASVFCQWNQRMSEWRTSLMSRICVCCVKLKFSVHHFLLWNTLLNPSMGRSL